MNPNGQKKGSITKPLLKELVGPHHKPKSKDKVVKQDPSVGSKPLPPPDLYQDGGSGYNPDYTYPQE